MSKRKAAGSTQGEHREISLLVYSGEASPASTQTAWLETVMESPEKTQADVQTPGLIAGP